MNESVETKTAGKFHCCRLKIMLKLVLVIWLSQSILTQNEAKISKIHQQTAIIGKGTPTSFVPAPHCGRTRYNSPEWPITVSTIVKRIVGGKASNSGEWPWLVTLQLTRNDTEYGHLCGGTLIDPQWVITAAHCFEVLWAEYLTADPAAWTVRVGEHNMFTDDDENQFDVDVKKIILHPNRNPPKTFNLDIALMKLVRPVKLNSNVNVVCLPSKEDRFPSGTLCVTAGWGHSIEDGTVSKVVQHVLVPIVSKHTCNFLYQKIASKVRIHVSNDMICAGFEHGGKDACQYDSGGPMVYFNRPEGRWILVGVVSTGYGCARPGFPGIYTRVSEFIPWIQEVLTNN